MNEIDRVKVRSIMEVIFMNLRVISQGSGFQRDEAYSNLDAYLILLSERIGALSLSETMAALRSTQFAKHRLPGWDVLLSKAHEEFTARIGQDRLSVYFSGFQKSAVNTEYDRSLTPPPHEEFHQPIRG